MADVFELFPIPAERRHQLAGTLSGGEQQMVALGRALMSGPRVLLVDEATTGLMPRAAEQVLASLERLKQRGLAVLLVEQNVRRALEIADHAYVMELGQVVLSGPGRQLLDSPRWPAHTSAGSGLDGRLHRLQRPDASRAEEVGSTWPERRRRGWCVPLAARSFRARAGSRKPPCAC